MKYVKKKKTRFVVSSEGDGVADLPSWPSSTSVAPPASKRDSKNPVERNPKRDFPDPERRKTSDDSRRPMSSEQRNSYRSTRRQDLIDLHLTLSRHRDQLIIQMRNVSNVILELAEEYHELKATSCVPCYLCELDLLIQESLAAYERRQTSPSPTVKEWAKLLSKEAYAKKRRRSTIIAEQPKRRLTELYSIPVTQLRTEVADLESDIEVYRKRISLDDRKIVQMGERWARDKRRLCCIRYFFLKSIIESAITDYRLDHR